MKKLIFLEHKDVLILSKQKGTALDKKRTENNTGSVGKFSDYFNYTYKSILDDFDDVSVYGLNNILSKTDAEIILTSKDKTLLNIENMCLYYKDMGVCKAPYDYLYDNNNIQYENKDLHLLLSKYTDSKIDMQRIYNIIQYISLNKDNIETFVVLDSFNMDFLNDEIFDEYFHNIKRNFYNLDNSKFKKITCKEGLRDILLVNEIIDKLNK